MHENKCKPGFLFKSHLISFMLSISFRELTSINSQMLNWKLEGCCDFNVEHVVNLYLWNIKTQGRNVMEKYIVFAVL